MSNPEDVAGEHREEIAALFMNLVAQQTNMAFMFLGRVPHPESGEVIRDLETAQFFIAQLEMLAIKTRGNLDKEEERLLKQSLTGLRMAFVEAVGGQEEQPAEKSAAAPTVGAEAKPAENPKPAAEAPAEKVAAPPPPEEESRKKFTKKY
jgi:hypothetical protein